MGNDEFLKDPESWPRFQAGDDLCGHQQRLRHARQRGPILGHRRCSEMDEPGVSRGIAARMWTGTAGSILRWRTSGRPRRSTGTKAAIQGRSSVFISCSPVEPKGIGPTRSRPGHPGADATGRPALRGIARLSS